MAEPRNPNDLLPDPPPHCVTETPQVRKVNSPDLGGSFEENGQVRTHDGIGAGPGLTVPDEGLRAAREAEKNSSAGS